MSPLLSRRCLCSSGREDDAAAGQVVRAELHHHAVLGEDPDVVLAHLPGDVREDLVTVRELYPEHRVRECLDDRALDLDDAVLLGHTLSIRRWVTLSWSRAAHGNRPRAAHAGTYPCAARTRDRRSILREACPEHEIGGRGRRIPPANARPGRRREGRPGHGVTG